MLGRGVPWHNGCFLKMQCLVANHSIVPDIGREEAAKMTKRNGRGAALMATLAAVAVFATLGSIAGAQGN